MASQPGGIGASKEGVAAQKPALKAGDLSARVEDEADVPDPDEDDLDDLDDLLDEFSPLKVGDSGKVPAPAATATAAASAAPKEPAAKEPSLEDLTDDDFAKQLQAGMADLLGEIESSPEMHAQFESIFKELSAAATESASAAVAAGETATASPPPAPAPAPAPAAAAAAGSSSGAEASFQETIRRTMERMQSSGEQATAAAAAEGTDDFMAELLKQMQSGGGLDGEENNEEFSKMLLGMMEQLTNKEILYEPMKELHEKFPEWLKKNKDKTPAEDMKRYEEQQGLVKEIVAKFEETSYSDANPKDREYIVDRMQKMQNAGSPPPDLVGDMPSAQDALSMPDESCNPQ